MAEHAERAAAEPRAKEAEPVRATGAEGMPAHEGLQRRAVAREAGYGALLNSRPPGPRPAQPPAPPNRTGLPDRLKSGIEALSGMSMDGVKVHYNSPKPAQLQAHAFAQGGDIHLGPGQERHLPHEAWHVVQQAQGRVRPEMQLRGAEVNRDPGLEAEADRMGLMAVSEGGTLFAVPGAGTAGVRAGRPAVDPARQRRVIQGHFFIKAKRRLVQLNPKTPLGRWRKLAATFLPLQNWDEYDTIAEFEAAKAPLGNVTDSIGALLPKLQAELAVETNSEGKRAEKKAEQLTDALAYLNTLQAEVTNRIQLIPRITAGLARCNGYRDVADAAGLAVARQEMTDLEAIAEQYELTSLSEHLTFTLNHVPAAIAPVRQGDPISEVSHSIAASGVSRGNRRGSVDRTQGQSRALISLQRDEPPAEGPHQGEEYLLTGLETAMRTAGLVDGEGRITGEDRYRVAAYVAARLGAGNCGEFANLVYAKMGPIPGAWVKTARLIGPNPQTLVAYDHQFNIVGPGQQLQDSDTVIDAWFNYRIMTLGDFLRAGNPYDAQLTLANIQVDIARPADGSIELNQPEGAAIWAAVEHFRAGNKGQALLQHVAAHAVANPAPFYNIIRVGRIVDDRRPLPAAPVAQEAPDVPVAPVAPEAQAAAVAAPEEAMAPTEAD